jgi:hypothetical protein
MMFLGKPLPGYLDTIPSATALAETAASPKPRWCLGSRQLSRHSLPIGYVPQSRIAVGIVASGGLVDEGIEFYLVVL